MFERFERPVKIVCLGLGLLLAWQLASAFLTRNPLAKVRIPPLPALPEAATTNEPPKPAVAAKNGTNVMHGTNGIKGMKATNAIAKAPRGPMAPMPGGRNAGAKKKMELPPAVKTYVDKIIESEVFGPVPHPMPMALLGIADQLAYIQATNGQMDGVKIGGEIGGIKLLRIGINRVLVEADGEKKELTLFDGAGGESLMPKDSPTPKPTNAPAKNGPTNQILSTKHKETP